MPVKKEESNTRPTDRMSITKELSSKRLLHYYPGLNRIQAINLMRKAYEHNVIATDEQIDNSTATGLHQGLQLRLLQARQQKLQYNSQHELQHRRHRGLNLWRHLSYDIIFAPLG